MGQMFRTFKEELKVQVLDIDTEHVSGIDTFEPGYIDKEHEEIVGYNRMLH